jgi:hypothetical protein
MVLYLKLIPIDRQGLESADLILPNDKPCSSLFQALFSHDIFED